MLNFVHLRLHTEYSLSQSTLRIPQLAAALSAANMPAVAMTDNCNLFAMVKFYNQMSKTGIKPIFGANLALLNPQHDNKTDNLLLLCKNKQGFNNLTNLVSQAYLEGQRNGSFPCIEFSWLSEYNDGLIALSGAQFGQIGRLLIAGNYAKARDLTQKYQQLFGDGFYLELQRTGREGEQEYISKAVHLATECNLPVVATNAVCFLTEDDFLAHEVRVCIHSGHMLNDSRRASSFSPEQYLKTPAQMAELFADIPSAIANSVEIAKRCNVEYAFEKYHLPKFPIPQGLSTDEYFKQASQQGLEKRLQQLNQASQLSQQQLAQYQKRLDMEVSVISNMQFAGYFLIVADFIKWAKNNGVPVGPGRGSGAGSIVAYALNITDLDPIAYDLLFERFLNPERVSMPDFDVDFCINGRDRVIDYVAEKYGREQVSQIITYGTLGAKAVVRDVGRVLGHGYGYVDSIAKMIPFEVGMTLEKALKTSVDLQENYENDEETAEIIDMALQLEGLARNAGRHAGGVVIAPEKLTKFTPLYCEEGGKSLVTQFDKDDVEAIGLVKFDFLGLRNLTVIDNAVKDINRQRQKQAKPKLDIGKLALDDAATFDTLKAQNTTAVFQLESTGMKKLIKKLRPDCFEDIIALVALFRPGPLDSGMVDDFIDRKHDRAPVSYPHPDYEYQGLEPVLKPTYGIILYQEQVMQIAQIMGGYSLGEADMLRRAMGKKKPEEMAEQKAKFLDGCNNNNIERTLAENIFDLVEKFAGYGFNKSHSAAYALVSYQTAWLKTHYPAEFMAAVLSADMDNTEKIVNLIEDCYLQDLSILAPDINHSDYKFSVASDKQIRYGLGAIKGVGQSIVESICHQRTKAGNYRDLFDFCTRNATLKINKRVLEALITSGALDSILEQDQLNPNEANRAWGMHNIDNALKLAQIKQQNKHSGQLDIFGMSNEQPDTSFVSNDIAAWEKQQTLKLEKKALGLYLSAHPFDDYRRELAQISSKNILEHKQSLEQKSNHSYKKQHVKIAGWVVKTRIQYTKQNLKIAILTLDDGSAKIEVKLIGDELAISEPLIEPDRVLIASGFLQMDMFSEQPQLNAKLLYSLADIRAEHARQLELNYSANNSFEIEKLATVLSQFANGACKVVLNYKNDSASARLVVADKYNIEPKQQLLDELESLLGKNCYFLRYH